MTISFWDASSTTTDHSSTFTEASFLSRIFNYLVIIYGYFKTGNTVSFQALWGSGNNNDVPIIKTMIGNLSYVGVDFFVI